MSHIKIYLAAELYKTGTKLPLTMSDFNNYVRKNILDTSEVCSMLEYSRQNLAYLLNKDLLKPIKEDVKGNLYQKGDVLKM